ncbi:MAG: hypothetical protein WC373_06280 [Smithella sp.]|jgi:phosphomannomutase
MLVESLSGVRGIFNSDLTEDVVRRYARAFAERLIAAQESGVAIGYDTRPSSAAISVWMIEEFLRAGISDIYNCKVASTAAIHLTPAVFKAGGAVMITASHNEPEWNGLKFMRKDGALLHPGEAEKLMNDSRRVTPGSGDVDVESALDVSRRLQQEYVLLLLRTIGDDAKRTLAERQLHIFVDANGGAAIPYLKDFLIALTFRLHLKDLNKENFGEPLNRKPNHWRRSLTFSILAKKILQLHLIVMPIAWNLLCPKRLRLLNVVRRLCPANMCWVVW